MVQREMNSNSAGSGARDVRVSMTRFVQLDCARALRVGIELLRSSYRSILRGRGLRTSAIVFSLFACAAPRSYVGIPNQGELLYSKPEDTSPPGGDSTVCRKAKPELGKAAWFVDCDCFSHIVPLSSRPQRIAASVNIDRLQSKRARRRARRALHENEGKLALCFTRATTYLEIGSISVDVSVSQGTEGISVEVTPQGAQRGMSTVIEDCLEARVFDLLSDAQWVGRLSFRILANIRSYQHDGSLSPREP